MEDKKVDIYIATLWRQGHVLRSLKSLSEQEEFGTATIVFNNWNDSQFQWAYNLLKDDSRIKMYRHKNEKESNEKLRYVGDGNNYYIMFADDDLIYPKDYLKKMIEGCEKYNAYVSLHGMILNKGIINSYYRDRQVFRGLGTVEKDTEVDIASNCGSLFKRNFFEPDYLDEWYEHVGDIGMDDIYTNFFCRRMGIKRYVLAHNEGYLKHKIQKEEDQYIFNKYALTGHDEVQTYFINTYFWDDRYIRNTQC